MVKWLLLATLTILLCGCAPYSSPSTTPGVSSEPESEEPPPIIERTPPPKRPSTTCPPGMTGSC